MFKRVEKRRRKKEEEEELGLNEEMKEIMGMHDTDSEESASDTDSDNSSDEGDEDDNSKPLYSFSSRRIQPVVRYCGRS